MVMAATDHGGHGLDHYQLLGVPREASRQEIAQAWRRRARAEHPDSRPADAAAAARFRALAEAYQVLADPARRAAYDRARTRVQQPAARPAGARVPVRCASAAARRCGPARSGWTAGLRHPPPACRMSGTSRWPCWPQLALRCLARDRDWPW